MAASPVRRLELKFGPDMDLKNGVKNMLRMSGHAFVSTVHERLNGVEYMLRQISEQNTHIAATQTALLQSGVRLLEDLSRAHKEIGEAATANREELQRLTSAVDDIRGQVADSATRADAQGLAADIEELSRGVHSAVLQMSSEIRASANQSVRQICVETSDYFFTNPELGLLSFLYSYLPTRAALDVGAHIGDVSEHLLQAGYEVFAFEPFPESYERLTGRLGNIADFHPLNIALGNVTGDLPLYTVQDYSIDKRYEDTTVFHSLVPHGMPADLSFEDPIAVPIRRLVELQKEGAFPADASLLKIDTEGYDLEVIRGMESLRFQVVMVEFWDEEIPFGRQGLRYTVTSMVEEMRRRGYLWYIVIYRVWGRNETAFYCNHDRAVPNSWGNIVFFQDRTIFAQAQQWCSAVLPRTYFKHVPAARQERAKEIARVRSGPVSA